MIIFYYFDRYHRVKSSNLGDQEQVDDDVEDIEMSIYEKK